MTIRRCVIHRENFHGGNPFADPSVKATKYVYVLCAAPDCPCPDKVLGDKVECAACDADGVQQTVFQPCCANFAAALESGTDNESYGRLTYWHKGHWQIGDADLAPIAFCPWCGAKQP